MTGDATSAGYFLRTRGFLHEVDSPFFPDPALDPYNRRLAYDWCLEQARWADGKVRPRHKLVEVKRGQFCHSLSYMGKAWGRPKTWVVRFFQAMADANLLRVEKVDPQTCVVTVVGYDAIQRAADSTEAASSRDRTAGTVEKRKTSVNIGQFADPDRTGGTVPVQSRHGRGTNQNQGNQTNQDSSGLRPAAEPAPAPIEPEPEVRSVVQLEEERDRLIWQEARTIFARVAPALPEKQPGTLMGQLVKAYGGGNAAKIQALQDLRRLEQMVASNEIAGYAAASTPKGQADAVRTFLQGMIKRAKEAPTRRPGSVAAKKNPPMTAAQRVYAMKYGAGGPPASVPESQGATIDGEWSDQGDDVREA